MAYPFGHGLSYTTFAYSGLAVDVIDAAETRVQVRLTVTNTGQRPGTETVQVYVRDPHASVYRPQQELRAFARITLDPGEAAEVTLPLDRRAFAYWHTSLRSWVVEGGTFEIRVGASSRDIHLTAEVHLDGDDIAPPLAVDSTADQWFAHPEGGPWLHEALGDNDFARLMADPRNGEMLRAVPLVRLTRMPGFPVTEEQVSQAVQRFARTP